jgi:hypothetical protein
VILWKQTNSFIRTFRINLTPLCDTKYLDKINEIDKFCMDTNIRWFNVPIDPWLSINDKELFSFSEEILFKYNQAFVNILAVKNNKIDFKILNKASKLIKFTSKISNDGCNNFKLGISTNITNDGPFFPFTMSSGTLRFSIALELTQEINDILCDLQKIGINNLRQQIIERLMPQISALNLLAESIEKETGIPFIGFDFSLAPILEKNGSIISILNKLGMNNFGSTGMFFATAYLTNIIKWLGKSFKTVGFSGIMYSLLEDMELCSINNKKNISLEKLISWSTMCGCGLDMVPVYGNITIDELNSILLDVATISLRLRKPLGVRILPIPNIKNKSKEYTQFYYDSDFVANTKVIKVDQYAFSFSTGMFDFLEI